MHPLGPEPDVVLDGFVCLSALTSRIKWMWWWSGERRPHKAAITECFGLIFRVHYEALQRVLTPNTPLWICTDLIHQDRLPLSVLPPPPVEGPGLI